MVEAKLMGSLKDGREVYEVVAQLDSQISALKSKGIKPPCLATPEEIALIRLDGVHTNWSRTSYAPAKIRGKPTIITSDSPYMSEAMARVAVKAHRNGEYPTLSSEFYEVLEDIAKKQRGLDPEERDVHIMQGTPNSDGVIKLASGMEDTRFLLKRFADKYLKHFNHRSIDFYDLPKDVPKNKTTMNYLWFGDPQGGSLLDARDGDLGSDGRASGVLDESRSDAPKKVFTLAEILDDEVLTNDFAPNQIKKIQNIFEQRKYIIIRE